MVLSDSTVLNESRLINSGIATKPTEQIHSSLPQLGSIWDTNITEVSIRCVDNVIDFYSKKPM